MPLPSVWAILTTDELAGLRNGGVFRESRMRKSGPSPLFLLSVSAVARGSIRLGKEKPGQIDRANVALSSLQAPRALQQPDPAMAPAYLQACANMR
jgi:hypothetical protein